MKLSVVIPVYNEVETIDEILDAVQAVDLDKEIILVDDYSTDGSRDKLKELDLFDWLRRKKREGKIRYAGFSFHDELPLFKEIIDSWDGWDFCQVQYNFMDRRSLVISQ